MFEKLFILVKNHAGKAFLDNPEIPLRYHDAMINEASSSIIEVLKNLTETGRLNDLVRYFQFSAISGNSLVLSMVNKFANKLNNFYELDTKSALSLANALIPPVMQDLVKQIKTEQNKEFTLASLVSKLNGNRADLSGLVNKMMVA